MSSDQATESGSRVSTLELFFDLVFVFTITQVALIVEQRPGWPAVGQALLELFVIFWMYGGFAWLTNTQGTTRPREQLVLILGMAALFVVSVAVPGAFGADGVVFGWAYLVLTVIHLAGFLVGGQGSLRRVMGEVGSRNLVAAAIVLAAGYLGAPWHWLGWSLAVIIQWPISLAPRTQRRFAIDAAHFGERHGLMIIIVLGESLISVAAAAGDVPVATPLIVGVLCGLACSAALWWCYFAGEDERAAEEFGRRGNGANALLLYDLPHMIMMAGILGLAAGSRLSLPDLTRPIGADAAWLIAGGAGLYLLALAFFRAQLRLDQPWTRLAVGVLVLVSPLVGLTWGAAQQLGTVALLVAGMLILEHRLRRTATRLT